MNQTDDLLRKKYLNNFLGSMKRLYQKSMFTGKLISL